MVRTVRRRSQRNLLRSRSASDPARESPNRYVASSAPFPARCWIAITDRQRINLVWRAATFAAVEILVLDRVGVHQLVNRFDRYLALASTGFLDAALKSGTFGEEF